MWWHVIVMLLNAENSVGERVKGNSFESEIIVCLAMKKHEENVLTTIICRL